MKYCLQLLTLWLILSSILLMGCRKYLDAKPDSRLSTPGSLNDLQAVLDNYNIMNSATIASNGSSDEFFLTESDFLSWNLKSDRDAYIWEPQTDNNLDWNYQYRTVFYANTVLDNLENIDSIQNRRKRNYIKGQALFFRAFSFFQIAQLFAKQYDSTSAQTDLGIPLRLTSNFNEPTTRSTLQNTYDQILNDLKLSASLIPSDILPSLVSPETKTRPNLPAVFAMLSKVYLQIGDYKTSKEYADHCLSIYKVLINYNDNPIPVNPGSSTPFQRWNDEILFWNVTSDGFIADFSRAKIDTILLSYYDPNDIRLKAFFRSNGDGTYHFKGSYHRSRVLQFGGIATDEVYLNRAECNARLGNVSLAFEDLNELLIKRYYAGTYIPYDAILINADSALSLILKERRKELVYRGIRWSDLKRLNKDPRFAIELKRDLSGTIYTLRPNDPRYSLLIPFKVIDAAKIQQNPR